jgi:hypothetical protein
VSIVTAPITIVLGSSGVIEYPDATNLQTLLLTNLSPFLLVLVVNGNQTYLVPFAQTTYKLASTRQPIAYTASALAGAVISAATSTGALLANWFFPTDSLPGNAFPVSLAANALVGANTPPTTANPSFVQSGGFFGPSGPISPNAVGDVICLSASMSTPAATAPTGGGVTTWNLGSSEQNGTNLVVNYWGVVTAVGPQTLTFNKNVSANWGEFGPAAGTGWKLDTAGVAASLTGPSLTPAGTTPNELAWYGWANGSVLSAGSTSGFVFLNPAATNNSYAAYDLAATSAVAPLVGGSASSPASVGMLLIP